MTGSFVASYWWALALSALFLIWVWRTARRALSQPETFQPLNPPPGDSTAPFRRADFEAKAALVTRQISIGFYIALGVFVLGFPVLFALSALMPNLPRSTFSAIQYALLGVAIVSMFASAFNADRLIKRTGLVCPHCRLQLVGKGQGGRTQDVILSTGKCPRCHTQLLDPAEVIPGSQKLTRGQHLQAIGLIAVLTAGLVGTCYFGRAAINAKHTRFCERRYRSALTAADSALVDTVRVARKTTRTCSDVRRRSR